MAVVRLRMRTGSIHFVSRRSMTGWLSQKQQHVIEYLIEDQVLRQQIGARRLLFTDDQRRRLAAKAKKLGRKVLAVPRRRFPGHSENSCIPRQIRVFRVSLFWDEMERRLRRAQIEALYDQHSRGLRAYACSVTGSFAAAEDAVHLVFERLLQRGIEISGPPTPYLYRAVHNAALNHIRSKTREAELTDIWLQSPAGMEQSGLELQSAIAELPQDQREVIVLHIWGEMSFEEISIALEISPNTAASRYRYGLSKLRTQFASEPSQRKP